MCGSHAAICVSVSSSTSVGENCRARKPAIMATAPRSCSDVTGSDTGLSMGADRKGFDGGRKEIAKGYRPRCEGVGLAGEAGNGDTAHKTPHWIFGTSNCRLQARRQNASRDQVYSDMGTGQSRQDCAPHL